MTSPYPTPTLLSPSSTRPSSVKQRNASVHSRINEVNIARIQARVIAEPTPQKQKAVCWSGEPHKITGAFPRICKTVKLEAESSGFCSTAKVDYTVTLRKRGEQNGIFVGAKRLNCRKVIWKMTNKCHCSKSLSYSVNRNQIRLLMIIFPQASVRVILCREWGVNWILTSQYCEAKEVQLFNS